MPASYSILAFGSTLKAEQHAHFIIHTQGFQRVQVQEIPFTQKITVSDGFWRLYRQLDKSTAKTHDASAQLVLLQTGR